MRIQPLQFILFSLWDCLNHPHPPTLLLPTKRSPPLRPSPPCFGTASLRIHKFARPSRWPLLSTKQQRLTAATPILAFLIALDRLTFKEITAGIIERWVLMEMHPFVWLSTRQTHDLAFFCSTTQKNLPHTLQCFQSCNYWGICKSIISKFLHREFVMSIIYKSNYDDVSFHLEYWIQSLASARRDGDCNLQLQELIARLQLQELLNVYYTTHCRSLAAERVVAGAKSLNEVLHKLISLSMINK
jgi:hypothetical protein